ncbi:MAG TPA: efflux RND transporter periplasmic adaptor subunit [Polyangiaceae bacterium]|jgi:RND family efflux transporter MFP subunit|nr:efflux RND transporter periplasmic adaptor subunit [Polyangiaceae bacterium]
MTTRVTKSPWIASIGLAVVVLGIVVGLFIQNDRHGWPFSLHHGLSAADAHSVHKDTALAGPSNVTRVPVEIEPTRAAELGVRTEKVKAETIAKSIRAVATVVPDESKVSHVHTRVAGWIERLYVNTTGQSVRAGAPLAAIFSQELLSSQTEYLATRRMQGAAPTSVVASSARDRLKVLGMTDAEIREVEAKGAAQRLVTVVAPHSGTVLHRGVSVGTAVDPSTEVVTIADLAKVWVFAEVPELDVPLVQLGVRAALSFPASNREPFDAEVQFLYPTLTERTRTLRVRFEVDNTDGSLRPGIYGNADFQAMPREGLTLARDAVVDTGTEQHVFVVTGPGKFAPRTVKLGVRLSDRVEIREGLNAGDEVVSSGVFLIDSESRLRASGAMGSGHVGHGAPKPAAAPAAAAPVAPATPASDAPSAPQSNHQGH